MELRKQYHFRPGPGGLRAWDVHRLIDLVAALPVIQAPLSAIRELDEVYWYNSQTTPTCRSIAEHAKLIHEADPGFPIILSSDGRVTDGMHRVVKAVMQGLATIPARQFVSDPAPDYVGKNPDELPN